MRALLECCFYLLVRGFLGGLSLLPGRLAYPLCGALGRLVYRLDGRHRRICRVNLGIAFPRQSKKWREAVARRSFARLGHHAVELSRLGRLSRREVQSRVSYEKGRGLENWQSARELRGAVLFVTAHVSAWELLPAAQALLASPLDFVVRPLDNVWLERWLAALRSRHGNRVLSKQGSLRAVLRALEGGRDVGFLLDQNTQEKEGVYVPFFGHPASTSATVGALAWKTGRPVVAGFLLPEKRPGHYRIRFYPPWMASPRADREREVVRCTTYLNACIEEVIREYPECWLWGHRRFLTQPTGENLYPV